MRYLSVLAVLLALFCSAAPASAKPIDDRNYAIGLLTHLQDLARQEAAALEAGLADSSVYLLRVNGRTMRVNDAQLDNMLAYMQLHRLLYPEASDALMAKAAASFGMPPEALAIVLEDPDSFAAMGTIALATSRLRVEADKHKAAILQEIADLRAFADQAGSLVTEISAAATWPPPPSGAGAGTTISPVIEGGVTVDYCLTWGTNCGQPVADEFCRRQGYDGAVSFAWTYMHPTRTLLGGEICDQDSCGGMTSVTCQ